MRTTSSLFVFVLLIFVSLPGRSQCSDASARLEANKTFKLVDAVSAGESQDYSFFSSTESGAFRAETNLRTFQMKLTQHPTYCQIQNLFNSEETTKQDVDSYKYTWAISVPSPTGECGPVLTVPTNHEEAYINSGLCVYPRFMFLNGEVGALGAYFLIPQ
jgi:hypothetical protein